MLLIYLRRRLHVSWHIAATCAALVAGVWLASLLPIGCFASPGWLLTGIGLLMMALLRGRAWMILLVIVAGLLIGLWRGSLARSDVNVYGQIIGRTVELRGTVAEDTDINKRNDMVLRLKNIAVDGESLAGTIWLTLDANPSIRRSDMITVNGKMSEGFGTFAASMYDAEVVKIDRPQPGDIALQARDWFAAGVEKTIREPESSLGLGYLVGQRRGLPEELDAALVAAGLTHIVVASGYNLTILVRFARRLFEKISKYLAFISASGMIVAFIAITGLSPSMSRAGLVAGLSLLAWYYGRRFHPLVLLPFAAAITVLVQPSYAWGDIGWQLSFAAFAGVMILAPLAHAYFFGDKKERPIGRLLIETLAAQICTLPILLYAFGQTSVIAPIANLLILPFVPLAMLLTFVAGIGGIIAPSLAEIIGFPAQLLLTYMTMTTQYLGGLSWAVYEVQIPIATAVLLYVLIAAIMLYMWRKTGYNLRDSSLVE